MEQPSLPDIERPAARGPAAETVNNAFGEWASDVARDLADELRFRVPDHDDGDEAASVAFLLGGLALRPLGATGFPSFYAGSYDPVKAGVRLLGALYAHAHDPKGARGLAHRMGFDHAPKTCVVDRFFAMGLVRDPGGEGPVLAYRAEGIDVRKLGCENEGDLEALHRTVLSAGLP